MLAAAPAVAVAANEIGEPVSVPDAAAKGWAPAGWASVPGAEVVRSAAVGAATVMLPVAGAAKRTAVPATALPNESVTLTTKGCARARATVPVWADPEREAMLAAGPAVAVAANDTGEPVSVPDAATN